ncbi:MAG: prepilin-type N-terminal cleavage/methylation domain-containing protein [Desulfatitalea sp.]
MKRGKMRDESSESGFTLIEMIASLALLALLASIFGMGLVAAVESYDFSRSNVQVAQKGQMAMARLIRELTELTNVVNVNNGPDPFIVYERVEEVSGRPSTTLWALQFNNANHQVLLYENPPNTLDNTGDILVDGVQGWSLGYFQGAAQLSCPFAINNLSTIQITLNLSRPDAPAQTQNFTTLIHMRNTNNVGGAVR